MASGVIRFVVVRPQNPNLRDSGWQNQSRYPGINLRKDVSPKPFFLPEKRKRCPEKLREGSVLELGSSSK